MDIQLSWHRCQALTWTRTSFRIWIKIPQRESDTCMESDTFSASFRWPGSQQLSPCQLCGRSLSAAMIGCTRLVSSFWSWASPASKGVTLLEAEPPIDLPPSFRWGSTFCERRSAYKCTTQLRLSNACVHTEIIARKLPTSEMGFTFRFAFSVFSNS